MFPAHIGPCRRPGAVIRGLHHRIREATTVARADNHLDQTRSSRRPTAVKWPVPGGPGAGRCRTAAIAMRLEAASGGRARTSLPSDGMAHAL